MYVYVENRSPLIRRLIINFRVFILGTMRTNTSQVIHLTPRFFELVFWIVHQIATDPQPAALVGSSPGFVTSGLLVASVEQRVSFFALIGLSNYVYVCVCVICKGIIYLGVGTPTCRLGPATKSLCIFCRSSRYE